MTKHSVTEGGKMVHYGDPCIHCGVPHDYVQVGACAGDRANAVPLAYAIIRQAWESTNLCDTIVIAMSDGSFRQEVQRPDSVWWDRMKFAKTMSKLDFMNRYPQAFA